MRKNERRKKDDKPKTTKGDKGRREEMKEDWRRRGKMRGDEGRLEETRDDERRRGKRGGGERRCTAWNSIGLQQLNRLVTPLSGVQSGERRDQREHQQTSDAKSLCLTEREKDRGIRRLEEEKCWRPPIISGTKRRRRRHT